MKRMNYSLIAAIFFAVTLVSCSKQEDVAVKQGAEKAAAEVKAKAEAEAKTAEAVAKEAEALAIATEAYVYAYPLVTMEMTRRVMTNVESAEGTRAPMGQFVRLREYPDSSYPGCHRAERGYALHDHLARRVEGALDPQHSGHEGTLLPVSDARRLDQGVRGARASAPREPRRRSTRSRVPAGRERCRPASPSTSRRPAWSGSWAASTAPARPRTTRRCTRYRTRCRWCRCPPTASRTRQRLARSTRRST